MTEHLGSRSRYRTDSTARPLTRSPWVRWDQISERRGCSGDISPPSITAPVQQPRIQFRPFPFNRNWVLRRPAKSARKINNLKFYYYFFPTHHCSYTLLHLVDSPPSLVQTLRAWKGFARERKTCAMLDLLACSTVWTFTESGFKIKTLHPF